MSDETEKYMEQLEVEWRKSNPPIAPRELLKIFPEAQAVTDRNIKHYTALKKVLLHKLRNEIIAEKQKYLPTEAWLAELMIINFSHTYEAVDDLNKRMTKLKRYLHAPQSNQIPFEDLKVRAKLVPIDTIALGYLEKVVRRGDRITACCPFHTDTTPSFCLYLKTNTFHCFGCACNGDVITFVMKMNNYTFVEAIRFLTNS